MDKDNKKTKALVAVMLKPYMSKICDSLDTATPFTLRMSDLSKIAEAFTSQVAKDCAILVGARLLLKLQDPKDKREVKYDIDRARYAQLKQAMTILTNF